MSLRRDGRRQLGNVRGNVTKRFFDIVVGLVFLAIFIVPMVVVGLLVLLFLGWPVFFLQERPGLNGRKFRIMKFRTMRSASDTCGKLLPDAERLTALGRFLRATSLDELPEIFNVIRGEMSLVGPRPLLVDYLDRYTPEQARRHEIRPGITGLAQVKGRNAIGWERKFELDVWYVDHHNLWLDLRILWMTIGRVLARHGVSAENHATMTEFMGTAGEKVV